MHVVANTDELVADGVITRPIAREIEARGRAVMVALVVNALLCFGILAATGGLIFWLAEALAVALVGSLLLGGGLFGLSRSPESLRMFGNAAALIGAGMLIGGAGIELVDKYEEIAGPVMTLGGALVAGIAGRAMVKGGLTTRFVQGAILLMGLGLHLLGIGFWLEQAEIAGLFKSLFYLYATLALVGAGWLTDVRLVTALAIAPFAQMLDTGTAYFHAAYMFYSPESTLSILQMALAIIVVSLFAIRERPERLARHGRIFAIMAFVVGNLCALVGSLWGDWVGETVWGPGSSSWRSSYEDYDAWRATSDAFRDAALYISADIYSVLWAVALVLLILWAAHRSNRGLFNTGVTFASIHAYTQLFESFADEPLAWVIGGFAAIPLAWGMWQWNQRWAARQALE